MDPAGRPRVAPAPTAAGGPGVRWVGAQRAVLAGDITGHVDLATLSTLPDLYGLGPLEGVRGEVSIFKGAPSIARIVNDAVVTTASWHERACFLVWAQVPAWHERTLDAAVPGLDALEREAVAFARAQKLDLSAPFPFRVAGLATRAVLHVLDKRDGLPHTPERHEQAKIRCELEDTGLELIGFHSTRHHGVFTPKESNLHVHARTANGRVSGHLEAIRLSAGARIGVPGAGWGQQNTGTA
jgi:acetolactate decarboxylase